MLFDWRDAFGIMTKCQTFGEQTKWKWLTTATCTTLTKPICLREQTHLRIRIADCCETLVDSNKQFQNYFRTAIQRWRRRQYHLMTGYYWCRVVELYTYRKCMWIVVGIAARDGTAIFDFQIKWNECSHSGKKGQMIISLFTLKWLSEKLRPSLAIPPIANELAEIRSPCRCCISAPASFIKVNIYSQFCLTNVFSVRIPDQTASAKRTVVGIPFISFLLRHPSNTDNAQTTHIMAAKVVRTKQETNEEHPEPQHWPNYCAATRNEQKQCHSRTASNEWKWNGSSGRKEKEKNGRKLSSDFLTDYYYYYCSGRYRRNDVEITECNPKS